MAKCVRQIKRVDLLNKLIIVLPGIENVVKVLSIIELDRKFMCPVLKSIDQTGLSKSK